MMPSEVDAEQQLEEAINRLRASFYCALAQRNGGERVSLKQARELARTTKDDAKLYGSISVMVDVPSSDRGGGVAYMLGLFRGWFRG